MENIIQKKIYNPYIIAMAIILPTFFAMLATSATNVCLPNIAGYFGATQYEANTVITSYMISNGVMLPLSGWFLKTFGQHRVLFACIILFAVGSFMCIIVPNLSLLILSRIVQGVGGGALMPLSQGILIETFPPEKRGTAMSLFALATILPPIVGPFFGGYLTDNYSWQWVFIANIPVCIVSLVLIKIFVPDKEPFKEKYNKKVDIVGFSAIVLALGAMQVVLDKGQQFNWFDTPWICWITGIAIFSMILFVVWELEYKYPLVDIRVFKNINFAIGTTIGSLVNVLIYSTLLLVPMFIQSMLGYTPFLSGLAIFPRVITCFVMLFVVGKLADMMDNRILIAIGLAILGASIYMYSTMNIATSMKYVMSVNLLFGAGIAFAFIPVSATAFSTLAPSKVPDGAGLHSLCKCTITAIATSVSATFIARASQVHQTYLVGNLSPHNPMFLLKLAALKHKFMLYYPTVIAAKKANGILYRQLLQQAKLVSFYDSFLILTALCLAMIPLIFFITKKKQNKKLT